MVELVPEEISERAVCRNVSFITVAIRFCRATICCFLACIRSEEFRGWGHLTRRGASYEEIIIECFLFYVMNVFWLL